MTVKPWRFLQGDIENENHVKLLVGNYKNPTQGIQVLHSLPGHISGCHFLISFFKELVLLSSFSLSGINFKQNLYLRQKSDGDFSNHNEFVLHNKSPCISSLDMLLCTLNTSVARARKFLVCMVTDPSFPNKSSKKDPLSL